MFLTVRDTLISFSVDKSLFIMFNVSFLVIKGYSLIGIQKCVVAERMLLGDILMK